MFRTILFVILSLLAAPLIAQTATVNGGALLQTMDGFGGQNGGPWSWASSPYNQNNIDSATATNMFSPSSGIGISIYRTGNVDGTSSTLPPDMASARSAIANGAAIELSMASPPSSMKYSGTFGNGTTGASGSCLSASNSTYATYIVQLLQNMASNGVTVAYLDIQNEPGDNVGTNSDGKGSCLWNAASLDSFVKVLGPALSTAGLSPKVILGSMYGYSNSPNYFGTCIADGSCSTFVSIAAGHGYGYPDGSYVNCAPGNTSCSGVAYPNGKHAWQSETSDNGGSYDASMTSAITMAQNMQGFLSVAQVSSYNWWELMYINNGGSCQDCSLVAVNSGGSLTYTKRFYAFGNWSKFVRPGQVEISATYNPQSGVNTTAFKNTSTGAFEIVAVNSNSGSVSQPFTLTGLTATSMTPYTTDPSNNLAVQSNITVSGSAFTATLTGSSVTTFVSNGGGGGGCGSSSPYTAASAAESDVTSCINGPGHVAVNGDVVQIPCSGTQSVIWTSPLLVSASITLTALGATPNTLPSQFGAGTNCLTIQDNVPLANGTMMVFTPTYAATNNVTTIQNMNIDPFSTSTQLWNPISIEGTGTSSGMPQARVDNIVFGNTVQWNFSNQTVASTQLIKPDNVIGVADHNTAPAGNTNELMTCQMSSLYGTGQYGDNSWAEPDSFGTSLNWFNENNNWNGGQVLQDCTEAGNSFTESGGGRVVDRFNMITGAPFQIGPGHGTESTGRPRGYREAEIYNNTLNCTGNCQDFASNRGGTILTHSNLANIIGGSSFMDQLFDITIFRRVYSAIPWGACGGLNTASGGTLPNTFPGDPWDTVDNTVYYTGSLTSVSGLVLTAGSPGWTANQWSPAGAGYSFYDKTQGFVSEILSNTSNTLTINQNAGIGNSWTAPANGDAFEIIRATVCMDQAGRGEGALLQGASPVLQSTGLPGPVSQALDPVLEWNDVVPASDVVFQYNSQFDGDILVNRDYYTDNWKIGGLSGPTIQSSNTVPFNGSTTCNNGSGNYTCGIGEGTLSNMPTSCTTGVEYWATDQGNWNQSGLACTTNGAGAGQGCQGVLYKCTSTNNWSVFYQPYIYPHPLVGGGTTPQAATPVFSPSTGTPPQTVTTTTTTSGATLCGRNDGGVPTASTPGTCDSSPTFQITGTQSVTINPTTLTAIATKVGFLNSSVATATYSGSTPAAAPVWTPGSGTYCLGCTITIDTPTAGCRSYIWWGSINPPTTSNGFNTQVLANNFAGTYYAKVIGCPGFSDSSVTAVTYAITPNLNPTNLTITGITVNKMTVN